MSNLLDAAQRYITAGLSILPVVYAGKRPTLDWGEFQHRLATPEELAQWFAVRRNIGVVAGRVSGNLVVLDFDTPQAWEKWLDPAPDRWWLPTVKTAHGYHVYVRTADAVPGNRRFRLMAVDVRGEGGYVVAPPSRHATGVDYTWQYGSPEHIPVVSLTDLGLKVEVASYVTDAPIHTVGGMPREMFSFVAQGTYVGNRDRKAYLSALRCAEAGVSRQQAEAWIAEGLAKSQPDRDPIQWAKEKVASAYRNATLRRSW